MREDVNELVITGSGTLAACSLEIDICSSCFNILPKCERSSIGDLLFLSAGVDAE